MKRIVFLLCFLQAYAASSQYSYRYEERGNGRRPENAYPVNGVSFNRDYSFFANMSWRHRERDMYRYTQLNLLTADQVRSLTLLAPNDREKAEYLNFAFKRGRVYDLQNFGVCGSAFSSREGREAFYRFINRQGLQYRNERPDNYDRYYNYNNGASTPAPYANTKPAPQPPNYGGDAYTPNAASAMTAAEFATLKETIRSKSFDSDKLALAKERFKNRSVDSRQVAEACKLYLYDDNRLEFAKFAYDGVVDKNRFGVVESARTCCGL